MKKIVITGSSGLLGWHTFVHLHAANCNAFFNENKQPYEIVGINHNDFEHDERLESALKDADVVFHFAGVNRGKDIQIENGNISIARVLAEACKKINNYPHIIYANSIHSDKDTPYGRSKKNAGQILYESFECYTDMILPHIFGEAAKAYYNNVTATLISNIINEETPDINPNGVVELLHAGEVAKIGINSISSKKKTKIKPTGRSISVPDLYNMIKSFHENYQLNIYPNLSDPFIRDLFNTYRHYLYPKGWPRDLKLNIDDRGVLFEAVKGGGGGQSFLSTTKPGITRGNHFHIHKVERFLVLQGDALIRIRKVLSDEVWEFKVSGKNPSPIDMPSLHSHSIENIGNDNLLTMFWTHDLFDPMNPDTFIDKVLK